MKNVSDKKKLIVVSALAVVIFGIGAFQLVSMNAGPDVASAKAKPKEPAVTPEPRDATTDEMATMLAQVLPERDPFRPGRLNSLIPDEPEPVKTEPVRTQPVARRNNPPRPLVNRGGGDILPLLPPMPSTMAGGLAAQAPGGMNVQPGAPLRQPGEFAYNLSGVVLGRKPVAVLRDDQGNERLVPLGGQIDSRSRLEKIEDGKVTIRHNGKTVTLTIGGSTSAKDDK